MANTMTQLIRTELNSQWVRFSPGGEPATFEAVIYNEGSVFASFRPTLMAYGAEESIGADWYRFVPAVSAKIPPGDRTQFLVEIFAVPPQRRGFTGSMSLALETHSPELKASDRKDLKLLIEGSGLQLPQLTLNGASLLEVRPQERLTLDLTAFNPNRKTLATTFVISGLPASWSVGGDRQTISLPANQAVSVSFTLQLPPTTQAPSGDHRIIITAYPAHQVQQSTDKDNDTAKDAATVQTILQVLPQGKSRFAIADEAKRELQIPDPAYRWLNPRSATATYHLILENQSNQTFPSQIRLHDPKQTEHEASPAEEIQQVPDLAPGDTATIELNVQRQLPWLGWSRLEQLEARAVFLNEEAPEIQNDVQSLRLQLLPVIPFWLQLATGGLLFLLLVALWGMRSLQGHQGPVYAVEFDGQARDVISAPKDQTLRRWPVQLGRLERSRILRRTEGKKSLRQARYRPFNNNEIALALENGEVEILNLLSGQALALAGDRADRVFDLAFSRDARTFFSGHGSGLIRQWDLSNPRPVSEDLRVDFAIRALALAGPGDRYLVIAGRNNQLLAFDRQTGNLQSIPHSPGGSEAYIRSLATAAENPNLLAVADDQGETSLWDLGCLEQAGRCQPLDSWPTAHNGEAVHAVALSAQGCFLATAGDDGRTKIWPLSRSGQRLPEQEYVVVRSRKRQNAVDVVQVRDHLLVVSGGDDHRVRLRRLKLKPGEASRCPKLK